MMAAMRLPVDEQNIRTSHDETEFMHRVLLSWALWAYQQQEQLGYQQCSTIWGVKEPGKVKKELNLDDDQLVKVDIAVAKLPFRGGRKFIFVDYWQHEPQEVKAKRFNMIRRDYEKRLDDLRQGLYNDLMPEIESWRLEVLQR